MKKRNLFLGAAAILLTALFSACSSDDPVPGTGQEDPVDDGGKVYMNIDITSTTANGSRSTTNPGDNDYVSSDEEEEGQDYENKISNIMVAIVGTKSGKDNCFIAKWTKEFASGSEMGIGGAGTNITADFNRSAFLTHYNNHSGESGLESVKVYVICNYDNTINDKVGTAGVGKGLEWITAPESNTNQDKGIISNATSDGKVVSYWDQNKILMTNYSSYPTTIPTKDQLDSNEFNSPSNAFSLTAVNGPILVERAVARFDYAPFYSTSSENGAKINPDNNKDVYYVLTKEQKGDDGSTVIQPEIQIRLTRMALVNMSKKFYLFRRVSDDGTNREKNTTGQENNLVIGGREIDNGATTNPYVNYVVDPEWSFKSNIAGKTDDEFKSRFHYWVNDIVISSTGAIANSSWDGINISSLTGDKEIVDKNYYKWRYVTPNTIPGPNQQKAGISTGVVFKAQISATSETVGIGAKMKNKQDIFAYGGKLLGSWGDVIAIVDAGKDQDVVVAYNAAIAKDPSLAKDTWNDATLTLSDDQTAAVVDAKFAKYGYVENDGSGNAGYFCYYYYWNRHNDNGNPGEMGPMEFGVVRNNVYKLAVTSIKRLGHPFRPGNDPDPVKPEDPDEESELYMTVSVKVMPWTKRVNFIEF